MLPSFIAKSVFSVGFATHTPFPVSVVSTMIYGFIFFTLENGHFPLCSNGSMKCTWSGLIGRYRLKVYFLVQDIYYA